jgi:multiple sugar transport system substrate-binding protein
MRFKPALIAAALAYCLSCSAQAVEVTYALWDSNQQPAYQKCADQFQKENADIKINIIQKSWPEYWSSLWKSINAGQGPDVFTNHLSQYPEFVKKNQIVDIQPYIKRDVVNTSVYLKGLYQAWGRDGKQYGMPKDWDTIAIIVNMNMAQKAQVTINDLQNMSWNPSDGGTFETIASKLTLDVNGKNALDPGFDKTRVMVNGYQLPGLGGMAGQVEWSHFAVSNGFKFQDKPWDARFYYDSPKLAETITWIAGLQKKGISAPLSQVGKFGEADNMFVSGKAAMMPSGSWMISYFKEKAKFPIEWVALPIGPVGNRATMFNGLADSIWVGSKNKEEAWRWSKYLASEKCQTVVADAGVVFPAINSVVTRALAAQYARGAKSNAFLEMSMAKTFMPPIAYNGPAVDQIMNSAFNDIINGKGEAAAVLRAANDDAIAAAKK